LWKLKPDFLVEKKALKLERETGNCDSDNPNPFLEQEFTKPSASFYFKPPFLSIALRTWPILLKKKKDSHPFSSLGFSVVVVLVTD